MGSNEVNGMWFKSYHWGSNQFNGTWFKSYHWCPNQGNGSSSTIGVLIPIIGVLMMSMAHGSSPIIGVLSSSIEDVEILPIRFLSISLILDDL